MKPKERVTEIVKFFDSYKKASNAATGAKYDSNANVTTKNIATMQAESIKKLGIDVQRYVAYEYIKKCFDEDLAEQYIKDLEHHIIYTNDESTLGGYPYCAAISLYPFLLNGLKDLGGSSGPPKHTNGYIGGLINLIFLVAGQLAGACMYKDQKILIKYGGKPYILSSEELFSKFSLGREIFKFTTLTDIWEYVDISDLGVEIYENDVWVPLRKVMRRAYKGEIYHLSTKGGREVFVSKDHRFKHFYRQRVFETRAEDLIIGDTVAADVEFSNIIDTSSDDYKIGQIIGLIAGDGNITDSYVRISINSDQSFIADFLDENIHLLNIPEISHTRIPDKRGQVFTYYVGAARAADIIKGFFSPEGYNTYTKNVNLEGRSLDWQFGFLDGLLTADGGYSPGHCLRISLTNFSLIQTVRKILNNLFFDAKISEHVPKKENKHTLYSIHIPMRALPFLNLVKKKPCYSGVVAYNSRPKRLNTKTPYYAGTTYGIVSAQNVTSVREHKQPGMRSDVIENITTFLNDHPYVYEVETETHWYNCGGLITHNCAVPETLVYMDHFLRLDFGQDYTDHLDDDNGALRHRIEDWFQQFVYSINQPAGSRNYQSPFTNISYYDKYYFASIFRDFVFPDGDEPCWGTTKELQKMFMKWFNKERTKEVLTFPVETMNLLWDPETKEYKDQEMADFTAEMWAEGHSFFLYNSDSADALSSCCRLKNKIESNVFSYTLGAGGVKTGSKRVITLNLNRIVQDWYRSGHSAPLKDYLVPIVNRLHKYLMSWNRKLWDDFEAGILTVFSAGFISLDDEYLTCGFNGFVEAAEFLGMQNDTAYNGIRVKHDNKQYQQLAKDILGTIKDLNTKDKADHCKFNTEMIPGESVGVKHYKWDKEDGYWVPDSRVCYNSYFYPVEDSTYDPVEKMYLHGEDFIGCLDGGSAYHCNLEEHLTQKQYRVLMDIAAKVGCSYFTFNIPNTICNECGHISKHKLKVCSQCGSKNIDYATRIVGYLKRISNFSEKRQKEAAMRYYAHEDEHA